MLGVLGVQRNKMVLGTWQHAVSRQAQGLWGERRCQPNGCEGALQPQHGLSESSGVVEQVMAVHAGGTTDARLAPTPGPNLFYKIGTYLYQLAIRLCHQIPQGAKELWGSFG